MNRFEESGCGIGLRHRLETEECVCRYGPLVGAVFNATYTLGHGDDFYGGFARGAWFAPGRWFVEAHNPDDQAVEVTLQSDPAWPLFTLRESLVLSPGSSRTWAVAENR